MNLEAQQMQSYADDGFLLLPDAIDAEIVERARQVMMRQVAHASNNPYHTFVREPAVWTCFDKNVCDAAA
jgi:hypothetical protein